MFTMQAIVEFLHMKCDNKTTTFNFSYLQPTNLLCKSYFKWKIIYIKFCFVCKSLLREHTYVSMGALICMHLGIFVAGVLLLLPE